MSEVLETIPLLLLKGRTTFRKEYSRKAISELSKDFRRRNFEKLYIRDLDGIERNKPQLDVIQDLSEDFSILYEAGPQRGLNVIDLIIAGADIVYMNTFSLKSLEEIELALSLTDRIGLKIDWENGLLGFGEGIEGASLSDVLSGTREMGASDFVVPMEVVDQTVRTIRGEEVVIRVMADRPEDARTIDRKIASIIVSHELLSGGEC